MRPVCLGVFARSLAGPGVLRDRCQVDTAASEAPELADVGQPAENQAGFLLPGPSVLEPQEVSSDLRDVAGHPAFIVSERPQPDVELPLLGGQLEEQVAVAPVL